MAYGNLLADVVQSSTSGPPTFNNTSGVEIGTLCRAWVNFDGTLTSPITPRASFNVGSVTKNATGNFTVNFTNAMPNINYAISTYCSYSSTSVAAEYVITGDCNKLVGSLQIVTGYVSNFGANLVLGDRAVNDILRYSAKGAP